MSPSSLKVTKKAIDEASGKSLAECLQIEYRLACTALNKDSDFYEGNWILIHITQLARRSWFNISIWL